MDNISVHIRRSEGKAASFLGKMRARLAYLQAQKFWGHVFALSYSSGIAFFLCYSKLKKICQNPQGE